MTTITEGTALQASTEAGAIIQALNDLQAKIDGNLVEIDPDKVYVYRDSYGNFQTDSASFQEEARKVKRRTLKQGSFTVSDIDSFTSYLAKHGTSSTEVWCNAQKCSVKAVIDAHGPGPERAYGAHHLIMGIPLSPEWENLTRLNGKFITQAEFAEFVENEYKIFVKPSALVMLEIAQTFQAKKKVSYQSGVRNKDGQIAFEYTEENQTVGKVHIPDVIGLKVPVYEGDEPVGIAARLQYRINDDKKLYIRFLLDHPEEVKDQAFKARVKTLRDQLKTLKTPPLVLNGSGGDY